MVRNVRVSEATHGKLRQLATAAGTSIAEIVEQAVDCLYRKWLLEECSRGYARLRADRKAWAEELKERELWDGTLVDGLEEI